MNKNCALMWKVRDEIAAFVSRFFYLPSPIYNRLTFKLYGKVNPARDAAVSAFLPVTASETFLDRLEMKNFDLTDRNLRSVGMTEHEKCTLKLYKASLQQQY